MTSAEPPTAGGARDRAAPAALVEGLVLERRRRRSRHRSGMRRRSRDRRRPRGRSAHRSRWARRPGFRRMSRPGPVSAASEGLSPPPVQAARISIRMASTAIIELGCFRICFLHTIRRCALPRELAAPPVRWGQGHLAQNQRIILPRRCAGSILAHIFAAGRSHLSSAAMGDLPDRVRLVIFDLDGVVYRGAEPVPGAPELVDFLHRSGVAVRFATNNSMATRDAYVDRLAAHGHSSGGRRDRHLHLGDDRAPAPPRAGGAQRPRDRRGRHGGRAARRRAGA